MPLKIQCILITCRWGGGWEEDESPLAKKTKHKKTIELSALATTQTSVKMNAQFTMSVKGFHNSINNNNDRQAASQA